MPAALRNEEALPRASMMTNQKAATRTTRPVTHRVGGRDSQAPGERRLSEALGGRVMLSGRDERVLYPDGYSLASDRPEQTTDFYRKSDEDDDDDDGDFRDDNECNQLIDGSAQKRLASGSVQRDQSPGRRRRRPTFARVIMDYFGPAKAVVRQANSTDALFTGGAGSRSKTQLRNVQKGPPPPPSAEFQGPPSSLRPALLIAALLTLTGCLLVLLIELCALVPEEPLDVGPGDWWRTKQNLLAEINSKLDATHRKQLEAESLSRWLVTSAKCHIPVLEPWDRSIRSYVRRTAPLNCSLVLEHFQESANRSLVEQVNTTTKSFTFVRQNKLYFAKEALELGALSGRCCYKQLARASEDDDKLEPASTACVAIHTNGLAVNQTLVEVSCTPPLNYKNVHSFIVHNKEEEDALKRVAEEKLNKEDYYNVLMVGVDTVSRANAQRQLNRTLQLLLSSQLYAALDFAGYNKVGENTFPNLIPFLTGLRADQLAEVECWAAKNYTDEGERGDDYLDNCKYLWNHFQQIGYVTYFSEDWPSASTFNYLKPGFKNEPTTYYGRPFTLAREKFLFPKFESFGCASCQLDAPVVQVDLENLQSFLEQHQERPYFAFHWINCPQHDDLNGASQVDHILERFFKRIHSATQNERTFVVFFSDHGYRWNDFVSTRIGHYESSLPLLTIAPPKRLIERHPHLYQHLKEHQNALLTPFDLFKTFIGIRDLSATGGGGGGGGGGKKSLKRRAVLPLIPFQSSNMPPQPFSVPIDVDIMPATIRNPTILAEGAEGAIETTPATSALATASISESRFQDGVSFKQKFRTLSLLDHHTADELDRSCIDAGIPDNFCVCHQFEPVRVDGLDVLGAAFYLVYGHLESRLRDSVKICHPLDLERTHQAELFDFERMPSTKSKTVSGRRQRRRTVDDNGLLLRVRRADSSENLSTSQPSVVKTNDDGRGKEEEEEEDGSNYLPNREYSIIFSTKPGGGLFQEVVRYYGRNMTSCKQEVERAKSVVEDKMTQFKDRQATVANMNAVCKFSVHSQSISRLNLYNNQSGCVKSNIELKKVCYCNDLL